MSKNITFQYDEITKTQAIPALEGRDRQGDIKLVARAFVMGPPSEHVVENKDLLASYVCNALGITLRVPWGKLTDEEVERVGVWQDYCCSLYDAVKPFLLGMLQ